MHIAELLEKKGTSVTTIAPDAPIRQAVEELTRLNIGALVVSSDASSIEGIISERDVVRALDEFGAVMLNAPVQSIASSDVHTCAPTDTIESLIPIMTEHRIRHIPVVLDGRLVGIVSIGDVVKTRMDELEQDRDALASYITAR